MSLLTLSKWVLWKYDARGEVDFASPYLKKNDKSSQKKIDFRGLWSDSLRPSWTFLDSQPKNEVVLVRVLLTLTDIWLQQGLV